MPQSPPLKVAFYVAVEDRELFQVVEYYRNDINALRALGHDVRLVNRPRALLRRRDDVLWVWWPTSGAPAIVWGRLCRRPTVLVAANSDSDTSEAGLPAKPWYTRFAARVSFATADITLPTSQNTLDGLESYRVRRAQTVALAVDTALYRPPEVKVTGDPFVLTISHLTPDNISRKRLLDIPRTAAEFRDRGRPERFVLAGEYSTGKATLQAEIDRLDVGDRVAMPGRVTPTEKLRLLQNASAYFQPTTYEAFGVAIAEAMACGQPVVSQAVGAVPEVVGDMGRLLAPDAGPPAMADALIDVIDRRNGALAPSAVRGRIETNFSIDARRAAIRRVLDEVIALAR